MSWCPRCKYGSASCKLGVRCPQCGINLSVVGIETKNPIQQRVDPVKKKEVELRTEEKIFTGKPTAKI